MKKKTIFKTVLSGLSLFSIGSSFLINNVNSYESLSQSNLSTLNSSTNVNENDFIDDVQDINRNTKNGVLYKTKTHIVLKNFYGDVSWSYDVSQSKFLKNSDGSYKQVTRFLTRYNSYINTIVVVGDYVNSSNENHSFVFQLNENDGSEYFINKDPSLSEEQKYDRSVILTEKEKYKNLTKNVSILQIMSKGSVNEGESTIYLHLFNDQIISDPDNNKPARINLRTYAFVEMSFDDKFFEQVNEGGYSSTTLLTIRVLPNWSFYVVTAQLNADGTCNIARSFIVNDTLNLETKQDGSPMRYDLLSSEVNKDYQNKLHPDQLIKEAPVITVTSNPTAGYGCVIYLPFIGGQTNLWIAVYYSQNPNLVKQSAWEVDKSDVKNISHLTWDEVNKQFYFTTTNTEANKTTLYKYDLYSAKAITDSDKQSCWGTLQSLSTDQKFVGSQLTSFTPINNNSQLFINKKVDSVDKIYGFKITMNNGVYATSKEVEIKKPIYKDFDKSATDNGIKSILPQDLSEDQLKNVLLIENFDASYYSTSLIKNSLKANNDDGTINYSLQIAMTKWWDETSSEKYLLTQNISLSGFTTNSNQKFQLVTNDWIDPIKFEKVKEIKKDKFLKDLTKQDILNYFISYGSGLSFSASDVSINGDIQDAQIQATTDLNEGILSISFNIKNNENRNSLNDNYKTGNAQWVFDKKLKNWGQITFNTTLLDELKNNKYASEVTLKDLVNAIDFTNSGLGYSTSINKWKWTPKYTNVNSNNWVQNELEGILEGTLEYVRDASDPDTTSLSANKTKITISNDGNSSNVDGNYDGNGFKKLKEYIFGVNENGSLDMTNAIKDVDVNLYETIASAYNKNEAIENLPNIIKQVVKTNNNWISSDQIKYTVNQELSNDEKIVVSLYIPNDANISLPFKTSSQPKLDSNWKNSLNSISPTLLSNNKQITLKISQAKFNWKIANAHESENAKIQIRDIDSGRLNGYSNKLPSDLVKDMESSSFVDFQLMTQLLDLSNVSPDDPNFGQWSTQTSGYKFIVQDIKLVPDDTKGEVTANYTLIYPTLNNATKTAKITIQGFTTSHKIMFTWIGIIIGISLILVAFGLTIGILKANAKKKKISESHKNIKRFNKDK